MCALSTQRHPKLAFSLRLSMVCYSRWRHVAAVDASGWLRSTMCECGGWSKNLALKVSLTAVDSCNMLSLSAVERCLRAVQVVFWFSATQLISVCPASYRPGHPSSSDANVLYFRRSSNGRHWTSHTMMVINGSCSTNMCALQLSFNFSSMVWGGHGPVAPPFGSALVFNSYLLRHLQWELATDHWFLNQCTIS